MDGPDNLFNIQYNEFISLSTERHIKARPPKQAYLYFPKGNDIVEIDIKNPFKTLRRVFDFGKNYTSFELEKINGLLDYIKQNNEKTEKEGEKVVLNHEWNNAWILRILQSHNYDLKITYSSLVSYLEWRKTYLPIKPSNNICKILNIGFIYSHGRDNRYRPIIVIKVRDFKRNYEKFPYEDWLASIIYLLEYILERQLIKGQIENWNLLCDCEDASVFSLPNEFKRLLEVLQNNYKCRLYTLFIMNIPFILRAIWILVRNVLDPVVQRKIKMVEPGSKELFKFINKSQIEKRFGGTAENMNDYYFPHVVPSEDYYVEGDDPSELLINEEEYLMKVSRGEDLDKSPYSKPIPEASIIYESNLTENELYNLKDECKCNMNYNLVSQAEESKHHYFSMKSFGSKGSFIIDYTDHLDFYFPIEHEIVNELTDKSSKI